VTTPTNRTVVGVEDFKRRYANNESVLTVIEEVLTRLESAPVGMLIGPPTRSLAQSDAARLDRLSTHERSLLPLFGIPFVVKDNIDVFDVATTAACPGFRYAPAEDATVVARLRASGAIVVGKANLDQFATGLVGTRSPFGVPPNSLDDRLVPGGSSSGSAVAVALGFVPFALGTDTAGSGRVPAAMNGIVGWKPTVGRMSTRGIVPAVRRFDCPSVFANSVADAAVVAAVLDAHDPNDSYSKRPPLERKRPIVSSANGDGLRIGVPHDQLAAIPGLDREIAEWFSASCKAMEAAGAVLVPVSIDPFLRAGGLLYGGPIVAERYVSIGSVLGNSQTDGVNDTVRTVVAGATNWSAADAYATEYELSDAKRAVEAVWDQVDVLAIPTVPHCPTRDEVEADPLGANERVGQFTTFVNVLDLCALIVPLALTESGDAVPGQGLQLVAPSWNDEVLEQVGVAIETGSPLFAPKNTHTIVVVGAHLEGQPLNHQLTSRGGRRLAQTKTAPVYRLYALSNTTPPKPGLIRVGEAGNADGPGASIEVEVWTLDAAAFGSFIGDIPAPLCIGKLELADGTSHHGFLCEPIGLTDAADITHFGGWRAYRAG
jgi:allophanate hydrolase